MRFGILTAVGILSVVSLSMADDVRADIKKDTNIPAETLGAALQTLARQRKFQIVYVSEQVDDLRTEGAKGQLTPTQALNRLLLGTGLTYQVLDEKTVTIVPVGASPTAGYAGTGGALVREGQDQGRGKEGKTSSSGGFRLAQVDQGSPEVPNAVNGPSASNTQGAQAQEGAGELAEITVIAMRRPGLTGRLGCMESSCGKRSGNE